jgi:hypothetical protein
MGASKDESVVRPATAPFSATGGLRLLQGNLGRSVIKVSAVPEALHVIEAPAQVFNSQEELLAASSSRQHGQDGGVRGALARPASQRHALVSTSSRRPWLCCKDRDSKWPWSLMAG